MRKRIASLLFLIFLINFSYSQTEKKFLIGLNFTTEYSYRSLAAESDFEWMVDIRNENEEPKIGFTTGVTFISNFSDRFALETGIQYSDKGEKLTLSDLEPVNPDDQDIDNVQVVYHYQYVGIPVKVNFYILMRELSLFVSAGGSVDFFISERRETKLNYQNGSTEESTIYGNHNAAVNVVGQVGLGTDVKVAEHFVFRAEAVYKHSINPIFGTHVKQYPWSVGINLGFFYAF